MSPRLLGTISAWYPEDGRGYLERKVQQVKTSYLKSPVSQVEHYFFSAPDVRTEGENVVDVAGGKRAIFELAGRDGSGRWTACRVRVLDDAEEVEAEDGAPGETASALFNTGLADGSVVKPAAKKGGRKKGAGAADAEADAAQSAEAAAADAEAEADARLKALLPADTEPGVLESFQQVARQFRAATPDVKMAKAAKLHKRAEENADLCDPSTFIGVLQRAAVCLNPPALPGGDVEAGKDPAQARLRKAVLESLKGLSDAEEESKSQAAPVALLLRRLIEPLEASGHDVSEAKGGAIWAEIKEQLPSFLHLVKVEVEEAPEPKVKVKKEAKVKVKAEPQDTEEVKKEAKVKVKAEPQDIEGVKKEAKVKVKAEPQDTEAATPAKKPPRKREATEAAEAAQVTPKQEREEGSAKKKAKVKEEVEEAATPGSEKKEKKVKKEQATA